MEQNEIKSEPMAVKSKKWVPRPLVTVCGVCGSPATDVHHYGATSCYSCRAFFRRTIGSGKTYRYCSRKTDSCVVDAVSRTNCKKCRFMKCLKVGMRPEKVDRVRKKSKQIKAEIKEEVFETNAYPCESETSECLLNGSVNIDIGALAEECIFEEVQFPSEFDNLQTPLPVTLDESNIDEFNQNEELDVSDNIKMYRPSIIVRSSPQLQFTFEEDFKIHELLVRKENLYDSMFQTMREMPGFYNHWESFLLSLSSASVVYKGVGGHLVQLFRNGAMSNFMNGGIIRQSLDMFDEYKHVSESVKRETFFFSMSVFHLCLRAILSSNKHKENFVTQHRASGTFTPSVQEACNAVLPDKINEVSSFDPFTISLFTSPWAAREEDEEFFIATLEHLGSLIKDDIRLGALYCTLILATPGPCLSKAAQSDPALHRVQKEMTLLIFRYLSHKMGDSHYAASTTSTLTRLLTDLHICREIHLYGRLNCSTVGASETKIEDLEV